MNAAHIAGADRRHISAFRLNLGAAHSGELDNTTPGFTERNRMVYCG
jgi:hypothetical protein